MNSQQKHNAERIEELRQIRKDFESVVKDIKQTLDQRQDDDFKMAILTALQHLEMLHHPNNLIAALMIGGCVDCHARGDENAARLLLYTSGSIVDPILTRYMLNTVIQARQAYVPEQPSKPTTAE